MSAFADGAGTIQEEALVTLIWESSDIDVRTTEWNEHSVEIHMVKQSNVKSAHRKHIG